jgi:hypothetical protein
MYLIVLHLALQPFLPLQRRAIAIAGARNAVSPKLALPEPGTALPLPPALASIDSIPGTYDTLESLSDGAADLLALVVSTELAMTDPLRQTLVGLNEARQNQELGAAVAAVSLVGGSTYRKLSRKAKVDYPLLSDAGREWVRRSHALIPPETPNLLRRRYVGWLAAL